MAPIERRDSPLESAAAQYVLDAKRDQRCVFTVVIERIAAGDAFNDEPGGFVQRVGNTRLLLAIDPKVSLRQVATQRISKTAGNFGPARQERRISVAVCRAAPR